MNLSFERLQRPQYVFAGGQRFYTAIQGLRHAGPYDAHDCPLTPRVLFVFPDEFRDGANRLFAALKNGIGPFKGTNNLLKFRLESDHVERVQPFSVGNLSDERAAEVYKTAIEERIRGNDFDVDLALILHRRTDRLERHNPYLTSKFPLLRANVPTQVVTTELLERSDTFQWSVANIALAMYAKMGGVAWAVDSGLPADSLVIGINRAKVGTARYFAFATVFAHNGVYLGTKMFPPADGWDAYLKTFRSTVRDAIAEWRSEVGTPANLILHVRREIGHEETRLLDECLREAGNNAIRAYAVLKLVEGDHMLLVNPAHHSGAPPSAVMVRLASHRALLQITGLDPGDQAFGKRIPGPWHVTRLHASQDAPPLATLCGHVLAMAAMNWRGLNAEASPVSVHYPEDMAELLARFADAGFDISELRDLPVMNRPWFI
jgi:hypothetical protein